MPRATWWGQRVPLGAELERLARDVRAARFHPGADAFTHEVIGKVLLEIDLRAPRCNRLAAAERGESAVRSLQPVGSIAPVAPYGRCPFNEKRSN